MFISTHGLIAGKVYEILKSELDLEINLRSMVYGSMAPDIQPSMMTMPHTLEGTIDLVVEMAKGLTQSKYSKNSLGVRSYSFKMGIVLHFLSDYFCTVHNEEKFRFIPHFIYEWRLGRYFERRLKMQTIKRNNLKNCGFHITDIKEFIQKKHREYIALRGTMSHDVAYSVSVCTAVALHIAACIQANEETVFVSKTA